MHYRPGRSGIRELAPAQRGDGCRSDSDAVFQSPEFGASLFRCLPLAGRGADPATAVRIGLRSRSRSWRRRRARCGHGLWSRRHEMIGTTVWPSRSERPGNAALVVDYSVCFSIYNCQLPLHTRQSVFFSVAFTGIKPAVRSVSG